MIPFYATYGVIGAVVYFTLRWLVCLEVQRNDRRREHQAFLDAHPDWQSTVKRETTTQGGDVYGAGLEIDDPNDPSSHHKRMIRDRIEQMRRDKQL